MYHSAVLSQIDALGRATHQLHQRPRAIISELRAEIEARQSEQRQAERRAAEEVPQMIEREAQRISSSRDQLTSLQAALERTTLSLEGARSELRVVVGRNEELARELRKERAELGRLRQERRLLAPPFNYDPSATPQPAQPDHPQLLASPRLPSPSLTSPSLTTPSPASPRSATLSLTTFLPAPLATVDVATQTYAPWHSQQLQWEASAQQLERDNERLHTALLASGREARPQYKQACGGGGSPRLSGRTGQPLSALTCEQRPLTAVCMVGSEGGGGRSVNSASARRYRRQDACLLGHGNTMGTPPKLT